MMMMIRIRQALENMMRRVSPSRHRPPIQTDLLRGGMNLLDHPLMRRCPCSPAMALLAMVPRPNTRTILILGTVVAVVPRIRCSTSILVMEVNNTNQIPMAATDSRIIQVRGNEAQDMTIKLFRGEEMVIM